MGAQLATRRTCWDPALLFILYEKKALLFISYDLYTFSMILSNKHRVVDVSRVAFRSASERILDRTSRALRHHTAVISIIIIMITKSNII